MSYSHSPHSGEWYRAVFEQAADGIFIINSKGRYIEVNQRGCEMLGYSKEELLRRSLFDLIPSEDFVSDPLRLDELATGQTLLRERRLLCGDGRYLPVEISASKLTDGNYLGVVRNISQRQQAEMEIKKLAKFPDENPNPILRIAQNGILLYANQASTDLLTSWSCTVGQRLPDAWYQIVQGVLAANSSQEKETAVAGRTYSLFFAPLVEDGYVNVYGYDITKRKQTLQALSESEAQYRGLFENMLEGFAYCQMIFEDGQPQDFIYLAVNNMFETLTGLKDVVGKRVTEVIPDIRQRDPELFDIYARVSLTGKPERFELFLKSLEMWFSVSVYSPEKEFFVAVFDVITERKQAEIALQTSEARLQGIIESAMDAIISIDENHRIILFNSAAEAVFACPANEALGQTLDRFIPERFHQIHREAIHAFGQTNSTSRVMGNPGVINARRANGEEFLAEATISQIEVAGTKIYTVIHRDITERKQAEEAQAKLEAQLRQAQKMESIGRLAGGVAHDFNNQLTVIQMFSDLIHRQLAADDPLQEKLDQIRRAGLRAADLTKQLLAFSRKQILAPKVINLTDLVTNLQKMLIRLIGEDIILSTVLQPDLWQVTADPTQIEQVIMNLVVNARDAMPTGGLLTITTENIILDENYARLHLETPLGSCVLLTVTDTGHGMDQATQKQLFEPFFTTKKVGEGTGLGLATAHGIIKQSGGNILVYSEPGQGTTFKIYLPASESGVETKAISPTESVDWHGHETILVAEDETAVRELITATLQELGYTVLAAPNGEEALSLAGQYQQPIDLLLTDVVMPKISGRELAETLQAQRPLLKTLFMSGYMDDAVVRHGLLQAEVAFLPKPFSSNILAAKVRKVLDK